MYREEIVKAFAHRPANSENESQRQRIAQAMSKAVGEIAGSLPECTERAAFIDLCRQAQAMANLAAGRQDPTEGTEPPDRAQRLANGVIRLGVSGSFHRATTERPALETRLETPPGTYGRAVFRFRVHHGGWNPVPSRNHNLFWFARDRHVDLFGFGVAKGRGGPAQVFYRTDWGVNHTNKQRVVQRRLLEAGETYDVCFDFDAARGRIVLTLTDGSGAEAVRAVGKPNITEFSFSGGQTIAAGFGFRGKYENEPAQPGWEWSDLVIELEPA